MTDTTTPTALDRAVTKYYEACTAVEKAALAELRDLTVEHYPNATGLVFEGEYGDDGDLNIELSEIQVGTLTITEETEPEWDQFTELANEFTVWLETVTNEDYLDTTTWTFAEIDAYAGDPAPTALAMPQTIVTLSDGQQVAWLNGAWHTRTSLGASWSLPLDESPTQAHVPQTFYIGEW